MEGDEVLSGSEAGEELHERYDDTQDERDWELSERSGGEEDDGLSDGQPDADAELDYDEENKDDYEQREHVVAQHQHISAPNEGSVITSDDGRGSRFDDDGSSITAEDAESANIEEHGESERPQSNTNSKADGEGLEDGGRNEPSSRQGREPSEEGEIDDLEEGELKSDSDFEVPLLKAPSRSPKEERVKRRDAYRSPEHECHDEDPQSMGVCRFYLRGTCTWGRDCKYIHPRETRGDMAPPAQSSSSELTWSTGGSPRVRTRSRDRGRPPRESVHSRVKYPNVGSVGVQEAAVVRSGAQESAWERGLRQARELVMKASKKRKEEPDFEKKRLILVPNEEIERPRTTDDDSDDSHGVRFRDRVSHSPPIERSVTARGGALSVSMRVDGPTRRTRRYFDEPVNANDVPLGGGGRFRMEKGADETCRREAFGGTNMPPPRRIPSLIDGIKEGRMLEPPKDLGPQVLYPNGRPTGDNRRRGGIDRQGRDNRIRDVSPNEKYGTSGRGSRSSRSRSPRSVSLSPRCSPSPPPKRRHPATSRSGSERSGPVLSKRPNIQGPVTAGGDQIRDPWDRNRAKRGRSRDLASTTLGAVLQKARRSDEQKLKARKRAASVSHSPVSSVSRGSSSGGSSVSSSRSDSRESHSSSHGRRRPTSRPSLASAVPLKNLFDDDGSIRPTDLSSFRIPKKKRAPSPEDASKRGSVAGKRAKQQLNSYERPISRGSRISPTIARRGAPLPGRHSSGQGSAANRRDEAPNEKGCRKKLSEAKEDISSDESSSSSTTSSSTSDDDAEPAAYRRKGRSMNDDDGLPTEGIPLSPDANAEAVSSDDEERSGDDDKSISRSSSHSASPYVRRKSISPTARGVRSHRSSRNVSSERRGGVRRFNEFDDDDYVDNEAEKEERRAELLRQLKCVEEAIARKRSRPIA